MPWTQRDHDEGQDPVATLSLGLLCTLHLLQILQVYYIYSKHNQYHHKLRRQMS